MRSKNKLAIQVCAVVVSLGVLAPTLAHADVVVNGSSNPPPAPAPVVVPQQQPATNTTVVQPVDSSPAPDPSSRTGYTTQAFWRSGVGWRCGIGQWS